MITVTCQYTGIEFEAATRRSKNHPKVSDLLNEAAKNKYNPGAYAVAQKALAEAKKQGMSNIDEIIAFARQRVEESAEQAHQRREAQRRQRDEIEEARLERQRINGILRKHGYTWYKEDEESMDAFGATAFENRYGSGRDFVWILTAPDGREVSVKQAMEEIGAQ